ncbi:FAD-binding protein [Hymenobacter sp. RP-2-7]|uniref:FAD-binding protein n=1 Tax=Hymenobacter polaris TaxID=2682546 RepID=A0A7Y0ADE6_9BACT|nr:FAD-dependent monooxygenase [Hymenobacter polaris]NML65298.1 FAD-binding protein [Hymenobacter polaris]
MPDFPAPLPPHVPVLIVGGGFAGLTAALCLQQQGLDYLLLERHPSTSILPKARSLDVRSLEIFRELGLAEALRDAGRPLAPAWGILRGASLAEALATQPPANPARLTSPGQQAAFQALAAQSPETTIRCTQDLAEPVLRQAAEARGGDLRFGYELVRFAQDASGVAATVRHRATGAEHQLTADYLLAADGANSPVRRALSVPTTGRGSLGHYLNVYFTADLAELVRGREFSMFLLREPDVTCFLLTINNADRWALHLRYYPELGQTPADFPEPVLLTLLRRVLGTPPEQPLRILSVLPWEMTVRSVEQEQVGRVFLAGDAAHTMTPYAGKGAAAGVQDVHNLAWKLAAVLRHQASPVLLATYQAERQPIGQFYADLSGDMADADGLIDPTKMQAHGPQLLGLPDYTYRSTAILAAGGGPTTPASALPLAGQPGTRLPHLWLDEAHQVSTLDWCRGQWLLVASGEAGPWLATAAAATLPPLVHELPSTARPAWQQLTGTQPGEALLVRPDGFVAARLGAGDVAGVPGLLRAALGW